MFDASLLGESRDQLAARLDATNTLARWARLVPAVSCGEGIGTVAAVLATLGPGSDPARGDTLLGALLRLAAVDGEDQGDAIIVVLHAVAPGASRLVTRGFDEGLVLGQLTIQIRTYPWRTRVRAVAANLLLDTEHALCRETYPAYMRTRRRARPVTEVPLARRFGSDDAGVLGTVAPDPAGADVDLVDLLLWAERSGVVDARDLSMLLQYHYSREFTGTGHQHVARVFGVNPRTSKRHCSAALQALRAAAPRYLAC